MKLVQPVTFAYSEPVNVLPAPSVTKQELRTILAKHYDLGELLSYSKMKKGLANSLYRLHTTKGDFTLKIAIRNNPIRIRYEIDLLNHLYNLPTPRPIETKSGGHLFNHKGHKSFVYPFLLGRETKRFTGNMLREVGEFLGKLHLETIGFTSHIERMEFYNISPKNFKKIIKGSEKLSDPKIQEALSYLETNTLRYRLPYSLPKGAMHIDLKPENTLFVGGKLSGVVDFDNSYIGPLVLDLANTLMWFCSKDGRFDKSKAKAIYFGYQKVRKLTQQERRFFFEAFHWAPLTHMLIDIYFLALRKLPKNYILWGLNNLLETEKGFRFTKSEFLRMFP